MPLAREGSVSSRGLVHKSTRDADAPTEFVRSHYRSAWTGAVLRRMRREYDGQRIGDLLTIVLVLDRRGNPMRRKIVTTLDAHWTTPVTVDTSWVNPDWWRILP